MDYSVSNKILPTYYAGSNIPEDKAYRVTPYPLKRHSLGALHYHECFEIGICTEGHALAHIGDRIYHCQKGDIQIILPYCPHINASYDGEESMWIWICFSTRKAFSDFGLNLNKQIDKLIQSSFCGVIRTGEAPELENAILKFAKSFDGKQSRASELELTLFLINILLESSKIGTLNQDVSSYTSKIIPAVQLISTKYADKELMREENIAAKCKMSVSYLRLLFKRDTGMSPSQFIAKTRISAAACLLSETEQNILDIALQCGFEQSSSFNHAFKRFYDMTPSQYRSLFGNF